MSNRILPFSESFVWPANTVADCQWIFNISCQGSSLIIREAREHGMPPGFGANVDAEQVKRYHLVNSALESNA